MTELFPLLFYFRCLLRDREVICREKDMEIRDLKEKIVRLSCSYRQVEKQKSELINQLKLLVSILSLRNNETFFFLLSNFKLQFLN